MIPSDGPTKFLSHVLSLIIPFSQTHLPNGRGCSAPPEGSESGAWRRVWEILTPKGHLVPFVRQCSHEQHNLNESMHDNKNV